MESLKRLRHQKYLTLLTQLHSKSIVILISILLKLDDFYFFIYFFKIKFSLHFFLLFRTSLTINDQSFCRLFIVGRVWATGHDLKLIDSYKTGTGV